MKSVLAATLITVGFVIGVAGSANADTFTLSNDKGGDGFVNLTAGGFDLFGADNGWNASGNITMYSATASLNESLTFAWTYTTKDTSGSLYDPAGVMVNGVRTQLSVDQIGPPGTGNAIGVITLNVLAGQDYGFYVSTVDASDGRADIAVSDTFATPLPAAFPLFVGGAGLFGWLARRRKQAEFDHSPC